jgi:hypothetical protein
MASQFRFAIVATAFLSISVWAQTMSAQTTSSASTSPLTLPLTMAETEVQTEKASLELGIGSLPTLSIGVDTGSVGLVLFATLGIPGNGITCDKTQTIQLSYGNPKRVTYGGYVCQGTINLAGVITTPSVPFALLNSLIYCAAGYECNTPQQNYADGDYGIFGVGISPGDLLPNPLRTLPGAYGKRFMFRLNADASMPSSLILAPYWNFDAAVFPQFEQTTGALGLPVYDKGQGCVLVNGQPTTPPACPLVSFDTGNGVPWLHAIIPGLQTVPGPNHEVFVAPGTTIGVAPRQGGPPAVTLVAGSTFASEFRYADQSSNLINVSIQAFLGNDVIYDAEQGVITIAPTRGNQN